MQPTQLIDKYLESLIDWRGDLVRSLRKLVHEVDSNIQEEWKWDTPVFSYNGNVCALGVFKDHVKINFFKGAALTDPDSLFNAGLESKKSRSINFQKDDQFDEMKLKSLIKSAIELNY